MKAKSIRYLRRQSKAFCSLRTVRDLSLLLKVPSTRLPLLAANPEYRTFSVRKEDGSERWIEDPVPALKSVQRAINQYLQSVYFFEASEAAYGFMINAKNDPIPRSILTNAQRHLGCSWLYNADIEDFFHYVGFEMVWQIFTEPPFGFEDELAGILTRLATFHERLPMGAPTSPVLSNFACREMDKDLSDVARWQEWTYTRFADDMSFSSTVEIPQDGITQINQLIESFGFRLNPEKMHLYGPEDEKSVTGLRLEETVKLPARYFAQLEKEIESLGHVLNAQRKIQANSRWVKTYREKVEGMLTFAAFVAGEDHPAVLKAESQLYEAQQPRDEYSAVSWLDFGYF